MIKVIKHGKRKKRFGRKFRCIWCECVFVATREDCHSVTDPLDQGTQYMCRCPDCGMITFTQSEENVVIYDD